MSPVKSIQDSLNSAILVEVEACQGGSGSVHSVREPLTGEIPRSRASQLKKKKKRKKEEEENADTGDFIAIQTPF